MATLRDLLYFFPRRHIDFSKTMPISALRVGEDQTAVGTVWESGMVQLGRNPRNRAAEAIIGDETGNIRAVWFNQPWMAGTLKPGMRVALSGRVNEFRGRKVFENAEYDQGEPWTHKGEGTVDRGEVKGSAHTGRLVPVYPLTAGLTPRRMRALLLRTVESSARLAEDFLP
ncbi:MAG: recG [Dehalococcoidia bacterium]|nr:recG [Dehalococcoidia bacterium]